MLATPAAAAEQFDLICSAKKTSEHYRLDLATGEYCWGSCQRIEKIASVTSGMITLMDIKPVLRGDPEVRKTINRSTGEWNWYSFAPRFDVSPDIVTGTCQPAPFSGFPAAKF